MKKIVYILFLISFLSRAENPPSIIFKENKGQWPEKVLFGADIFNTQFYVNKNSFNYCVWSYADLKTGGNLHHTDPFKNSVLHGHNYEVEFIGADLNNFTKTKEQPEYYNYFLGNNKKKWASRVKAYENVLFNEIYEGIDLKLYSNALNLKYDFIVKPNANINSLKLNYKHIEGLEIKNNELLIKTSVGIITEKAPFAYQFINGKEKEVKCNYVLLKDDLVGFVFPDGYNKNYELVIDPTVVVCSYSGYVGTGANSACGYDASGNIYVFGYCGVGYPTSVGAFSSTYFGHYDNVLSMYNPSGSSKIFATYLGGDSLDLPFEVIVKNNQINLLGTSSSTNFPCSSLGYDTIRNGGVDFVVTKLNSSGTSLIGSTYVGGSRNDGYLVPGPGIGSLDAMRTLEMVVDTSNNVFVFGNTQSPDFPVTTGVISSTLTGATDACVFKLDNTLSNLVWSTYLGGNKDEVGKGIHFDNSSGLYLCGTTTSTNFPTTSGVISQTKNGPTFPSDIFLTHINSSATSIIASTYIGTIQSDYGGLIDLDINGNIYILGYISSPGTFTSTPGVYSNANGYNTVHKINPSLSTVIFKTKFGNAVPPVFPAPSPYLEYTAFMVDSCQSIYLGGFAENVLPTTANQIQPYAGGMQDIYLAIFNSNCSSLKFASYWGGSLVGYTYGEHSDGGLSAFDSRGRLYQALCSPGGLPTTSGAYCTNYVPSVGDTIWNDAFVKFDMQTFINAGSSYGANIIGCPPFTPTFVSSTNLGTTYWNLGNGVTSTKDTISTTYTNLGNYNILLVVTDTSTCNKYDSIKSILSVINPTEFDLGDDIMTCNNVKALIKSNVTAVTYSWSSGQTTPNIYALPGTYTLTINNGGCNSSDVIDVVVGEPKLSERFPNVMTPNGDQINDWIYFTKYNFDEVEFILYDRWGRERYKINNPQGKWQPDNLENGTYFWVVNYKSSCTGKYNSDKGFISIFK